MKIYQRYRNNFCNNITNKSVNIISSAGWDRIIYNYGKQFDGTTFTAPFNGIYSFTSTAYNESSKIAFLRCYVNEEKIATAGQCATNPCHKDGINGGSMVMQTTLALNKKDEVTMKLRGSFNSLQVSHATYFEGRLVSILENV